MSMMRHTHTLLTKVHRWTGLALLLFLVIVGSTGALLPFQENIQRILAPDSDRTVRPPEPGAALLDPVTLLAIAERRSGGVVDTLPLDRAASAPASFDVAARKGGHPIGYASLQLDPYTGREIGRDGQGGNDGVLARVMPFLYRLHTSLALGDVGVWILGVAALVWTVDCFIGFYLTLPMTSADWWRRWRPAWLVRWPSRSAFRLHFDLHRAVGLWVWPMLFVFAWSSVGFNLRPAYDPIMGLLFDFAPAPAMIAAPPARASVMGWNKALQAARAAARTDGARRGYVVERERALFLDRESGSYAYVVRTSRDRSDDFANSWFTIDGHDGRLLRTDLPTGEHTGNTVDYWLGLLHEAGVFGLPYRIAVSLIGALIVSLAVTGTLIWSRKRLARRHGRQRSKLR